MHTLRNTIEALFGLISILALVAYIPLWVSLHHKNNPKPISIVIVILTILFIVVGSLEFLFQSQGIQIGRPISYIIGMFHIWFILAECLLLGLLLQYQVDKKDKQREKLFV